jgi:hypothetical protein
MTRRPKIRRGRRNFTLDELLTDAESSPMEDIALDLAPEVGKRCEATISEARASCIKKRSGDN